jgi:type VI secretion system VasD/TssJ family lipoprotein
MVLPLAVATGAALSGCGIFGGGKSAETGTVAAAETSKGGRTCEVAFTCAPLLNSCGDPTGNALVVRVYQLSQRDLVAGLTLNQLWDREKDELKETLVADPVEIVLEPNAKQSVKVRQAPGAEFLVIAGGFCKTEGDCWLWIRPFADLDDETKLTLGESCIEEAP